MAKACFVFFVLSLMFMSSDARPGPTPSSGVHKSQFPRNYMPSGEEMYKDYCAVCHGADGKGRGPMAAYLTRQPSDLTVLAKNHGGAFPEEYVASVLRFGFALPPHGNSEMPIWGPIFQRLDGYNEAAVQQRIRRLCGYLESIQEK
jgi:hypothetical protein